MPRLRSSSWTPRSRSRLSEVSAIQELFAPGFSRSVPSAENSARRNAVTVGCGAPNRLSGTVLSPARTGRTPSASKKAAKNLPGYISWRTPRARVHTRARRPCQASMAAAIRSSAAVSSAPNEKPTCG